MTLKNLAEISKTVQPVVAQIQTLTENANRLIAAIDPDKVRDVVGNVQTFSQSLAASSDNFKGLVRDGAALANHLNDSAKRLDTALIDVDQFMKAVDSQKIAGIVDQVNDVVATVRQNRGNIDLTLKNFGELSGKLNNSADKVDGVLTSRPKLPWLARHEGRGRPHQRRGALGEETRRRHRRKGEGHWRRA